MEVAQPIEYSRRLGRLRVEQFQMALDRFKLGMLQGAEPIPFGLFGQNVFLKSTTGDYVLRGSPHFDWQFPLEKYFVELLHERTEVPVPWPYLYDVSSDIFGWSYVIMPRLPGLQIADPQIVKQLPWQARMGIARAMGETLAQLHTVISEHVGRYDSKTGHIVPFELHQELAWPFPPKDLTEPRVTISHSERIIALIRNYLALCRTYNPRTTIADADWTERLIEESKYALTGTFQPCFVMVDYKEGNVVVRERKGEWHVSGVFDFMEAHFADAELDLSRQTAAYLDEDPHLAAEFVRVYLKEKPPRVGFAERFPLYMLLDRLIIWEYFQRNSLYLGDRKGSLRDWAQTYTACLPRLYQ